MNEHLSTLFPEDLYHSYIVEGDPETVSQSLREVLFERGDIVSESSDVISQLYDAFTIADSGFVKEWHSTKGITSGKKICIIGAKFINREAEESLLKIIEEPGENTHFFIVVPNASLLLDTIRSRAHIIKVTEDLSARKADAVRFMKMLPNGRIDFIAELVEEHKDSVGSGGLRASATLLINGLEELAYKEFKKDMKNVETQFALGELANARNFLSIPGASVKMILEHIALVL